MPSNNGLGVEKIVIFLVTEQYFIYAESQYFLVAGVYGKQNIKTSRYLLVDHLHIVHDVCIFVDVVYCMDPLFIMYWKSRQDVV